MKLASLENRAAVNQRRNRLAQPFCVMACIGLGLQQAPLRQSSIVGHVIPSIHNKGM